MKCVTRMLKGGSIPLVSSSIANVEVMEQIRLTDSEKKKIVEKMKSEGYHNLSAWLRKKLLGDNLWIDQKIDEIKKIFGQRSRVYFQELFFKRATRNELIVTFLGILELTKPISMSWMEQMNGSSNPTGRAPILRTETIITWPLEELSD